MSIGSLSSLGAAQASDNGAKVQLERDSRAAAARTEPEPVVTEPAAPQPADGATLGVTVDMYL